MRAARTLTGRTQYSQNELTTAVKDLEQDLVEDYPEIRAVLVTDETPDMIQPEEDSAYINVYLLNVAAHEMLDVEDKAYAAWRKHRPDECCGMCLFMYSPQETEAKFPRYAGKTHDKV